MVVAVGEVVGVVEHKLEVVHKAWQEVVVGA